MKYAKRDGRVCRIRGRPEPITPPPVWLRLVFWNKKFQVVPRNYAADQSGQHASCAYSLSTHLSVLVYYYCIINCIITFMTLRSLLYISYYILIQHIVFTSMPCVYYIIYTSHCIHISAMRLLHYLYITLYSHLCHTYHRYICINTTYFIHISVIHFILHFNTSHFIQISAIHYTNIDFCWGEYVIIFFKNARWIRLFLEKYDHVFTEQQKSIFVLLFLLSDENYTPNN